MGDSALSISARPRLWDEVIGQDRAIRVLKSILRDGRFAPRGFVLEGPHGVGKTSTALILAKALMCTGDDPLGCGVCPSCQTLGNGVDGHPDFREVDAASYSGVTQARQIVDEAIELPGLAKTRVLLVDEAHRLSREAWDVYLKPLEQPHAPYAFIFATTDAKRIPATILSRCCIIRFTRVATPLLSDYLAALAARRGLDCEAPGLKLIARAAKGHVRDALVVLDKVASLGKVTQALVETVIDTSYSDMAVNVLLNLVANRLPAALELLDEMARTQPVARAISEVFSAYGRAVFEDPTAQDEERERLGIIRDGFASHAQVSEVMIKWSSSDRIPVDALPLFAHELYGLRTAASTSVAASQAPPPCPTAPSPAPEVTNPKESEQRLVAILGAIKLEG